MKSIVTYFSASGNTAHVANRLADAVGADIFEIRPAQTYSKEDLNWWEKDSRSTVEMNDLNSRPEIAKQRDNMGEYDVVYVGFPIWWNAAPRIVNTFLESYDFSGKIIVPFATSGGSGVDKVNSSIRGSCAGAELKEAKLLPTDAALADLSAWAESVTK